MAQMPPVRLPSASPDLSGFAAEALAMFEAVLPSLADLVMSYLNRPSNLAQRNAGGGQRSRVPKEPITPPIATPKPVSNAVDIVAAGLAAAKGCTTKADCGTHFLDACIAVARANGVSPAPCLDFADSSYGMGSPRLRAQFEADYDSSTARAIACPTGFTIDPTTGSCVLTTST